MRKITALKTFINIYEKRDGNFSLIYSYNKIGRFSKVKEEKIIRERYGEDVFIDYTSEKVKFTIDINELAGEELK